MKRHFRDRRRSAAFLGCVLLAAAPSVFADVPALNVQQLGITESMLHYCAPLDPTASKRLQDKIADLVRGSSERSVAEARESEKYRHAYQSVVTFTAQIDEHNAKRFCAEPVAPGK